jgi:hypothetical protein
MVCNPDYVKMLPGWRCFRIEYCMEGPIEGRIWLPPGADPEFIEERLINLIGREVRECECCKNVRAVWVASSSLGAVSHAYCMECLRKKAEPFGMLYMTYEICGGQVADWFWELVTYFDGEYKTARELEGVIKEQFVSRTMEDLDRIDP